MTVIKKKASLPVERIYTDTAITGAQFSDMQGNTNRLSEEITDTGAPGSVRICRGHTHNSLEGRGIYRTVIGAFYTAEAEGPPLTITTSATDPGESFGAGNSSAYPSDGGTGNIMGTAYVSPGVDSIKVEFLAKNTDAARTVDVRPYNITDNAHAASWTTIGTNAAWYTSGAIAVTPTTDGSNKRIELDIYVRVDADSDTVYLMHAFPFEYEDED
jgi:hypothetical protein